MEWQGPARVIGWGVVFGIVWTPIVYVVVTVWDWFNPIL